MIKRLTLAAIIAAAGISLTNPSYAQPPGKSDQMELVTEGETKKQKKQPKVRVKAYCESDEFASEHGGNLGICLRESEARILAENGANINPDGGMPWDQYTDKLVKGCASDKLCYILDSTLDQDSVTREEVDTLLSGCEDKARQCHAEKTDCEEAKTQLAANLEAAQQRIRELEERPTDTEKVDLRHLLEVGLLFETPFVSKDGLGSLAATYLLDIPNIDETPWGISFGGGARGGFYFADPSSGNLIINPITAEQNLDGTYDLRSGETNERDSLHRFVGGLDLVAQLHYDFEDFDIFARLRGGINPTRVTETTSVEHTVSVHSEIPEVLDHYAPTLLPDGEGGPKVLGPTITEDSRTVVYGNLNLEVGINGTIAETDHARIDLAGRLGAGYSGAREAIGQSPWVLTVSFGTLFEFKTGADATTPESTAEPDIYNQLHPLPDDYGIEVDPSPVYVAPEEIQPRPTEQYIVPDQGATPATPAYTTPSPQESPQPTPTPETTEGTPFESEAIRRYRRDAAREAGSNDAYVPREFRTDDPNYDPLTQPER